MNLTKTILLIISGTACICFAAVLLLIIFADLIGYSLSDLSLSTGAILTLATIGIGTLYIGHWALKYADKTITKERFKRDNYNPIHNSNPMFMCPYDTQGRSCKQMDTSDNTLKTKCEDCDWFNNGARPSKF